MNAYVAISVNALQIRTRAQLTALNRAQSGSIALKKICAAHRDRCQIRPKFQIDHAFFSG
jgi:hypothetical protein